MPKIEFLDYWVWMHVWDLNFWLIFNYLFIETNCLKHAFFNEKTFINDIALIYLKNEVTLSNVIQIACLPSAKSNTYPSANTYAYAAGWGTLSYEGTAPSLLNNVKLNIYSSSSCNLIDAMHNYNAQICAGNINYYKVVNINIPTIFVNTCLWK